ncbi:Acetyltransferase (GNAT) domain-containing protein [Pedobacter caeni]|uniref:Acetyltransferase (GNAT) domain-containing protein n=2 Tax=Pedobacter caeni TaxID=288992 RepID=A0A1M5NLH9_9SPHI|nr:Acetyltransferase (GNAT) domain-containing protein [Pedobacter caeni]
MDLFLLADPEEKSIQGYLPDSLVYIAKIKEETIAGYILQPIGEAAYELKNIAVMPGYQNQGIGRQLLDHLFKVVKERNGESVEVGTGTFGYQLAFYQRAGFRADRIDKDFFLLNYKEAIFENGIQHKDMLRLVIKL